MDEVFVARQAIFDPQKEVYGYELMFRTGFEDYYARLDALDVLGPDKAKVDLMAFVNFGELTDGKRGFVTFTPDLLVRELPSLFPNEMMTVGLAVDTPGDENLLARCRELKAAGCEFALNGLAPAHVDHPLLDLVDLVKIDFAACDDQQRQHLCEAMAARGVRALGRNVQTAAEFDQAAGWGYAYFQGDFFTRPDTSSDRAIAANKLIYLQVLNEVNRPELQLEDLEGLIKQDVSMTYRLLKFMNSVWFGLRYEVHSIKHALVLLGPKEVRKWATLLAVADAGEDKPRELLLRSLTRARAAEQLADSAGMSGVAAELFLMGMFSVIDALMDRPMADILEELPLNADVKGALLGEESRFRTMYDLVIGYESGQWERFSTAAASLEVDESAVPDALRKASKWANEALEVL